MSDRVRARIDELVKSNKVFIFMKGTPAFPMCGFSAATVQILDAVGLPYDTFDVLEDAEVREGVKSYSNWPTIPQVFVNGQLIGGCDIVRELHERGELEPMIRKALEG